MPAEVRAFLREADHRIERFRAERPIPAFVPSDYVSAYAALHALAVSDLAPGHVFCEWGSGFGVMTCLASMLEFEACGIEIEGELVEAARQLADDFDLPVEFFHGNFIPPGKRVRLDDANEFAWLATQSGPAGESGLGPDDFDVIFAYPWPGEERAISDLFEHHAGVGAILMTYHAGQEVRMRRKCGGKARRPSNRTRGRGKE